MTPDQQATWDRMPNAERERLERTHQAIGTPLADLVDIWAMVERNEAKARARRSDPAWTAAAREAREKVQDASDRELIQKAMKGEHGAAAKRAVEELVMQHQGNDERALLRAARRTVVAVRHGDDRRAP